MANSPDESSWNTKEESYPPHSLFGEVSLSTEKEEGEMPPLQDVGAFTPARDFEIFEEGQDSPLHDHKLQKKHKSSKKKLKKEKKRQKKLMKEKERAERRLRKAAARAETNRSTGETLTHEEILSYHLQDEEERPTQAQEVSQDGYEENTFKAMESLPTSSTSFSHQEGASAYFEGVLEKLKQRKSRKQQLSTADCIDFVHRVLQQMRDAREADDRATEENRPAVAKLQMLDYVVELLSKPKWKELFISEGCCQALASWLAPLKDEKLPNITIRQKLLQLVEKLPIQAQELQNNDLGVVLVMLWKHEDETEDNRTLIRLLIQRWMRPLLGLASSFKDYRLSQQMDTPKSPSKADGNRSSTLSQERGGRFSVASSTSSKPDKDSQVRMEKSYRHARRPEPDEFNFMVQPKSDIDIAQTSSRKRVKGPLNKILDVTRVPKIPQQAQKVSLEGRDILY